MKEVKAETEVVRDEKNGTITHYKNGRIHREDGPACYGPDHITEYFKFGKRHREDGPAVITLTGEEHYFLEDEEFSKSEFFRKQRNIKLVSGEE